MNAKPEFRRLQSVPVKKDPITRTPCTRALGVRHKPAFAGEGTEDIGRIARSIGFSMSEASEIERIYKAKPKGMLK